MDRARKWVQRNSRGYAEAGGNGKFEGGLRPHSAMCSAPSLLEVGHLDEMSHPQGGSCLSAVT